MLQSDKTCPFGAGAVMLPWRRRAWRRAVGVVGAATLTLASHVASANTVGLNETFKGTTAPGWLLEGSAILTAPSIDPDGEGWLRLTPAGVATAGSAIYDTAFSSTAGVDIQFQYATYGGSGADGLVFYLIDGATAPPTVGSSGGSLGYSWSKDYKKPGVTNGYVGIGLDEWGNFSAGYWGACDVGVACARIPNSVTVRGSGSLWGAGTEPANATGFSLLATKPVPDGIGTTNRAGAKTVHIVLTPAPDVTMTVQIDGTTVMTLPLMTGGTPVAGMTAAPPTFKMGFSSSTGGANNIHEVRGMGVTALPQAQPDTYTTALNQPLTVATDAPNALVANDGTVPAGWQFSLLTPPDAAQGTATVDANGSFTFTPANGFTGDATFTYQICSGPGAAQPCTSALVTIRIAAPRAVPTLEGWVLLGLSGLLGALGVRRARRR